MNETLFTFPPEGKMMLGKRYKGPTGVEVIVTKSGKGLVTDGEVLFQKSDAKDLTFDSGSEVAPNYLMPMGKRFSEVDPMNGTMLTDGVELLVIKPGKANIRCNGFNMELITPKILPSAD